MSEISNMRGVAVTEAGVTKLDLHQIRPGVFANSTPVVVRNGDFVEFTYTVTYDLT